MAALGNPIVVDGSHGEGGGALVRTALVMSALTQQPLRIQHVRGGTKFIGLDYEDLVLARALAKSCSAETTGVEVGSNTISFLPTRKPKGLNGALDQADEGGRRAASAPVVLNALLPVLARTGMYSSVTLSGETYGHRSLGFDYFQNVTVPTLAKMGLHAFPDQEEAGFGRDSTGRIAMDVEPSAVGNLAWGDRGKLLACRAMITTAELPANVMARGVSHLQKLADSSKLKIEIDANPVDAKAAGAFVTIWCQYERGMGGATAMGAKGVKMETLIQGAFEEMLDFIKSECTVDPFLADQILIPATLTEEETTFKTSRLTQRLLTSIWVIKQFLPIHITVRGTENNPGIIVVKK